jgi:subtilase family serine protease
VAWGCPFSSPVDLGTGSIAPGGAQSFFVTRPSSCVSTTTGFTITADATNVVQEGNEANNAVTASCVTWATYP